MLLIPSPINWLKIRKAIPLPNALLGINHWDKPSDLSGTGITCRRFTATKFQTMLQAGVVSKGDRPEFSLDEILG